MNRGEHVASRGWRSNMLENKQIYWIHTERKKSELYLHDETPPTIRNRRLMKPKMADADGWQNKHLLYCRKHIRNKMDGTGTHWHLKIWHWREKGRERGEEGQVTLIRTIGKVRRMRQERQNQTGRMTQQDHLMQVYSSEREIQENHTETMCVSTQIMKIWVCLSPAVFFWKIRAAKLQPWRWNLVVTVVPSQENRFQSCSRAAVSWLFARPLISLCQLRPYQTWY